MLIRANFVIIKFGTPKLCFCSVNFKKTCEIIMIFYLKHTKGKGIFSNFSSSKLFYENLRYENKVHDF